MEHILPKSFKTAEWWKDQWDVIEGEEYKHRLGNIVLTDGNIELSNKSIENKLDAPEPEYCYNRGTNSEKKIQVYTNGTYWRTIEIGNREFDLIKWASKRWSVPCCSDIGNVRLKYFDDVINVNQPDCYDDTSIEEDDVGNNSEFSEEEEIDINEEVEETDNEPEEEDEQI